VSQSNSMSVTSDKVVATVKGFLIAAASAGLTYLATNVLPTLQDQPGVNALLFVVLSVGIQAARKFLQDTSS